MALQGLFADRPRGLTEETKDADIPNVPMVRRSPADKWLNKNVVPLLLSIIGVETVCIVLLAWAYLNVSQPIDTTKTDWPIFPKNNGPRPSEAQAAAIQSKEAASAQLIKGIPAQAAFPRATTELPGLMDLLNDPELSPYFLHQMKNQFLGSYLDLFQSLELDSGKAEALRTLLAERLVSSYEVVNLSRDGSAWSVVTALEESKSRIDSEIRHLLGEESFKAYSDYQAGLGIRNTLKGITRPLAFSRDKLSPQQLNALVAAISSSASQATRQSTHLNPSIRAPVTFDQISAHAAAASLTEPQLKRIAAEMEWQERARQLEVKNSARFQQYLKTWAQQTGGGG